MPPSLDIYIFSRSRDLETINRFIAEHTDREASQDRGDEELTFYSEDSAGQIHLDESEGEPALSLSNIVQRGLDYPRRAFWVSLKSKAPEFVDARLGFTTDNRLVLGLSIDDPGAKPENLSRAKSVLQELARNYRGYCGLVTVEHSPPLNERKFRELTKNELTVFSAEFD